MNPRLLIRRLIIAISPKLLGGRLGVTPRISQLGGCPEKNGVAMLAWASSRLTVSLDQGEIVGISLSFCIRMGKNFISGDTKSTRENAVGVADLLIHIDAELGSCWRLPWLTGHGAGGARHCSRPWAGGARHGSPARAAEAAVEVGLQVWEVGVAVEGSG